MQIPFKLSIIGMAVTVLIATAALAHQGVKDPHVKARMHAMGDIAAATKTLGAMAKGQIPFESTMAADARNSLIAISLELPGLFEINAVDRVSEAKPDIWDNFPDFVVQADAMKTAAQNLDVTSVTTLREGVRAVGASCGGCHKAYRVSR